MKKLTETQLNTLFERNKAALMLETRFPRARRRALMAALFSGLFLVGITLLALTLSTSFSFEHEVVAFITHNMMRMIGLASIFSALWITLFALELFSLSSHFDGLSRSYSREELYRRRDGISFEVLLLLYAHRFEDNFAEVVMSSPFSERLHRRLGMNLEETLDVLAEHGIHEPFELPLREDGKMVLVSDLVEMLYRKHESLERHFFSFGVTDAILEGALELTRHTFREEEKYLRSWSRIHLGEIPGVAKDWASGGAYKLKQYASEVSPKQSFSLRTRHAEADTEAILSRTYESNALIIGDESDARDEVAPHLAFSIAHGKSSPTLEGKRVFILDTQSLIAGNPNKYYLERELSTIFHDAARSGQIILILKSIAYLVKEAGRLGISLDDIIEPYAQSDSIQLVAFATHKERDTILGSVSLFSRRFDTVLLQDISTDELLFVLARRTLLLENRHGKRRTVTFQALARIAELAEKTLPNPTLPDDALDILEESMSEARLQGRRLVVRALVDDIVTRRTGIPVGQASQEEADLLLTLEAHMRTMVVGQDEALVAIASSLRRTRVGLTNPNRPIGTFLFLGPTGVGKTHVARSLEKLLFKEGAMHRLDMSEFSDASSLERLIGSTQSETQGILEEKVSKAPYGILLLDEFEKASVYVRNLFLQILDEGHFSNAHGKKISLKNLVIIATSNACAEDIIELSRKGASLALHKEELVRKMITNNIFRPELLNRFDDIILFEPLTKASLREIARNEIKLLSKRTQNARIRIAITDDLLDFLVTHGYDALFGARPMRRLIDSVVERILSEKILKNEIHPGETLTFSKEELERVYRH